MNRGEQILQRAVEIDAAAKDEAEERELVLASARELGLSEQAVQTALATARNTDDRVLADTEVDAPPDHVAVHLGEFLASRNFERCSGTEGIEVWRSTSKSHNRVSTALSLVGRIECRFIPVAGGRRTRVMLLGTDVTLAKPRRILASAVTGSVALFNLAVLLFVTGLGWLHQGVLIGTMLVCSAYAVLQIRSMRRTASNELEQALNQVAARAMASAPLAPDLATEQAASK